MGHLLKAYLAVVMVTAVLSEVDIMMEMDPVLFELGLSTDLTISCTAQVGNTSDPATMNMVTSLIISKDGVDLAAVFNNNPKPFPDFDGTITEAVSDMTGTSKLSINFKDPIENDTGVYECTANGMNDFFTPDFISTQLNVSSHAPDATTAIHQIVDIEQKLKNLTAQLSGSGGRWQHVDTNPLFHRIPGNLSSDYLLSKADMGNVHMAQFVCFVQGGYLAEPDTEEEFEFIHDALAHALNGTTDATIWLGISDEGEAGVWENFYNKGGPGPHLDWGSFSSGHHCVVVTSRLDYYMDDLDCTGFTGRALCEIPHTY